MRGWRRRSRAIWLAAALGIIGWTVVFFLTFWRLNGISFSGNSSFFHTTLLLKELRLENHRHGQVKNTQNVSPRHPTQQQQQQQQQQHAKNQSIAEPFLSLSVPNGCEDPPGDPLSVEGSHMGYQVLRRLGYGLMTATKNESIPILCVLPFFSHACQRNVLETFDPGCNGILFVQYKQDHSQTRSKLEPWILEIMKTTELYYYEYPLVAAGSEAAMTRKEFVQYLSNLPYEWIHWCSPSFYFVVGLLRAYVTEVLSTSAHPVFRDKTTKKPPQLLQPWRLVNVTNKQYWGLFGAEDKPDPCFPISTFHQSALDPLFHDQTLLAASPEVSLTEWITHHVGGGNRGSHKTSSPCAPIRVISDTKRNYNTAWLFLKRYFEIRVFQTRDFYRLHALIHNICSVPEVDALDELGRSGYVANVTYLRHHPWPMVTRDQVCQVKPKEGDEGPHGFDGLKKIRIQPPAPQPRKVLCMIYTHQKRHDPYLRAIAETWGPRCDGFFAASTVTDRALGAIHLLHDGPEIYDNMWMKTVAIFRYAYRHYFQDFDFFHIGGDDHYVIPENLGHTVSTGNWRGPWNQSAPLFLGGSLPLGKRRYCGGGSGYTLNRVALQLLLDLLDTPRCWPRMQSSDEDRIIASCFRQLNGLQCMDTNDDRNESRYHTWHVEQHAAWRPGLPCQDCHDLPAYHGIAWKPGLGQISESSVSFHLKNPKAKSADSGMRRYHCIIYGMCQF